MQVQEWMTASPVSVPPTATVYEALQVMMDGNVRRLPVVQDGKLVGIISHGTLNKRIFLSMLPSDNETTLPPALGVSIDSIMEREVITTTPGAEVNEAAQLMITHGIGALPVVSEDGLIGILTVQDLFKALRQLESQTRLHALDLQREVRARTRHLEVLNLVSRAATRSLETHDVVRDIMPVIRQLFAFDRASLLLLDDGGESFNRYELYSDSPREVLEGERMPRDGTISGWVTGNGHFAHIVDLLEDQERFPNSNLYTEKGMRSAIVVPLTAHKETFGTLNFGSRVPAAFEERDVNLAQQVARQVAQAIHNVRQYQRTNHLVEKLKEADRVRNEFMGMVSHDLRSPLASLHGYLQLFQAQMLGPLPVKYKEVTIEMQDIAQYMLRLVEDLLQVGQLGARGLQIHPERVRVTDFIRELLNALEAQAAEGDVTLSARAPEGLYVLADPDRLRQMLTNLIVNGIKFNRPGGTVRVIVSRDGEHVVFDVKDTGTGIAAKDRENIFDLFTRGETDNRAKGSGLGLFIARQLAVLHEGSLEVESTPGQGSCFFLRLPVAPDGAPARPEA